MTKLMIDAASLRGWLGDGREIALLDVREAGQFGEGHPFFAVPLPYSRFEAGLPGLAPNRSVRMVLLDDGDGVAEKAARRAEALGYTNVHVLAGGAAAWAAAGYVLFRGVNLPSKAFGELIEHSRHTPRIAPADLVARRQRGDDLVIIDGRPFAEYRRMNIPGGVCCPNGELALRIRDVVPDPKTTIVVNCAGRTRSIIGAQTLIDLGVPNPVLALENGTQGWFLAGLELERGAGRRYPDRAIGDAQGLKAPAMALAAKHRAVAIDAATAHGWLGDAARTTYLLDVRTAEEIAAKAVTGFVPAAGGQLIQATDQWVGVRGARLVLADEEGVRAPVVAAWLRQLGHEAYYLAGGIATAAGRDWSRGWSAPKPAPLATMSVRDAREAVARGAMRVVDLRASTAYRTGHIPQATWAIRPRIAVQTGLADSSAGTGLLLVADDVAAAALAAIDLAEAGARDVRLLDGGMAAWSAAGLPVESTPNVPAETECIDYLFFVHDRHDGNAEAARQYIAWEQGLVAQLAPDELATFRI